MTSKDLVDVSGVALTDPPDLLDRLKVFPVLLTTWAAFGRTGLTPNEDDRHGHSQWMQMPRSFLFKLATRVWPAGGLSKWTSKTAACVLQHLFQSGPRLFTKAPPSPEDKSTAPHVQYH
ncbi:hypothetical protein M407DRAFT_34218 [Tulasnella calospora MUT 4182]|uniref:Uncharacterized protein n=1 Tax=Tulasnella calospora MUT 4182 TaxID=1051891 RepID=A0A0C3L332_9AGAM|nr:hypothetical protein M407DRAFT_34218 [Tulasnella calospora MUT 4182]